MKLKMSLPPAFYAGAADRKLYGGRCMLVYARLAAIGAAGTLTIYDGDSTDGVRKLSLQAADAACDESSPPYGIVMEQGVYVDIGGGTSNYTIGIVVIQEDGGEG